MNVAPGKIPLWGKNPRNVYIVYQPRRRQRSCKNLVNFGPLTPEFTVMVWRPFMRQRREIGETRSILGPHIRQWMARTTEGICAKFTRKTCLLFGPSLGRVGMSRSKVKRQGHQGQKTRCALTTTPQYGRNGMASLHITSRKQQAHRFDRWRGVSSLACVVHAACGGPGGLPLGSATHF